MFDHWKVDDKFKELGWPKKYVEYFKRGMADSMLGEWNDSFIRYDYDREMKLPPDRRETAYVAGYRSGEGLLEAWAELDTNIILGLISGDSIGEQGPLKSSSKSGKNLVGNQVPDFNI